jgi:hypothetical protein
VKSEKTAEAETDEEARRVAPAVIELRRDRRVVLMYPCGQLAQTLDELVVVKPDEVRRPHPSFLYVTAAHDDEARAGPGLRPLLIEIDEAIVDEPFFRHADVHRGHEHVVLHLEPRELEGRQQVLVLGHAIHSFRPRYHSRRLDTSATAGACLRLPAQHSSGFARGPRTRRVPDVPRRPFDCPMRPGKGLSARSRISSNKAVTSRAFDRYSMWIFSCS